MAAQRKLGWEVINGGGGGNFIGRSLIEWKPDVMHFHWLHPYMLRDSLLGSFMRSTRFIVEVFLLKLLGTRIAWTIHNLSSHDGRHRRLERFFTVLFAKMADIKVAHSREGANLAAEEFKIPSKSILVMPHPGYCGYYPDTISRDEARLRFGYGEEDRVFLFLGRIQPYKGIFDLLEAFSYLPPYCRLLIAGVPADEKTAERLRESVTLNPRIQFYNGYAGRNEVQWFYRAADMVVFPFRKILTSGSVMLAMSFGKPLILPEVSTMREMVGEGEALWFQPGSIQSLKSIIRVASEGMAQPTGSRNAATAAALTWEGMAQMINKRYFDEQGN